MASSSDIVLVVGGDLHVQRPEPESAFAGILPVLKEADIVFGNLEGIPSEAGRLMECRESGGMRSDERNMAAYTYAGFSAVGLSNNHSMDFGPESLLRAMDLLDGVAIAHTGGGIDIAEARKPAIVERKGTRVAFLSYSTVFLQPFAATKSRAGIATLRVHTSFEPSAILLESPGAAPIIRTDPDPDDLAALVADVRDARAAADVVVVSCHWGLSPRAGGTARVVGYETVLAHAAIDAGADLVVGHHPHMLEAVEVYRGKCIFYSLGNFAFDFFAGRKFEMERKSFGILRVGIRDRRVREVAFLPTRIPDEDSTAVLLETTEAGDIVEHLRRLSEPFGTRFEVGAREMVVETGAAVPAWVGQL